MPTRTTPARRIVTCTVAVVVPLVVGLALFHSPTPVVQQPRVAGVELAAHGGYALWRVAVVVVVMLALALWAGLRRTALAAAWAAAAGAFVVPLVVAARHPSAAGDRTTLAIGLLIGVMVAGFSFLGVSSVGTLVEAALDRRERRAG